MISRICFECFIRVLELVFILIVTFMHLDQKLAVIIRSLTEVDSYNDIVFVCVAFAALSLVLFMIKLSEFLEQEVAVLKMVYPQYHLLKHNSGQNVSFLASVYTRCLSSVSA